MRSSCLRRFQSTLPRGSDLSVSIYTTSLIYFNPRSLAGATDTPGYGNNGCTISIHAPSRERPVIYINHKLFNLFQSTLPRGSDLQPRHVTKTHGVFQSTLPRGSDSFLCCSSKPFSISIHAPSRERLSPRFCHMASCMISIHAPSRERRRIKAQKMKSIIFQSTLPRGSDQKAL